MGLESADIAAYLAADRYSDTLPATDGIRSEADSIQHWNAFRDGHTESFTLLYYKHIDTLYHYGERLTGSKALIEDCLQDLFAELWSRQTQLPEVSTVKFYLFKALKHKIVKKLVQQQKFATEKEAVEGHDFEITLTPEFELADHRIFQYQKNNMLRAINQLPPRQKEAITLYFYDGFSYQEIGEIMAMETRSVYNLVYRALASLRDVLTSFPQSSA